MGRRACDRESANFFHDGGTSRNYACLLLQLPSVFLAAGLCGFRAGLYKISAAAIGYGRDWRNGVFNGRGWARMPGRLVSAELSEKTLLRRSDRVGVLGGLTTADFLHTDRNDDSTTLFRAWKWTWTGFVRLSDWYYSRPTWGLDESDIRDTEQNRKWMRMPRRFAISIGLERP